jgi:hypothetical protein
MRSSRDRLGLALLRIEPMREGKTLAAGEASLVPVRPAWMRLEGEVSPEDPARRGFRYEARHSVSQARIRRYLQDRVGRRPRACAEPLACVVDHGQVGVEAAQLSDHRFPQWFGGERARKTGLNLVRWEGPRFRIHWNPAASVCEPEAGNIMIGRSGDVPFGAGGPARQMVRQGGGGSIINVTSQLAEVARPERAAYVASKGGGRSLTQAMALELTPHGIRVNAIAPGALL